MLSIFSKNKNKAKKTKAKIILAFVILFIIIAIWYTFAIINPMIIETSEAKIKSLTQHTLSNAVLSVASNIDIYKELIDFSFDDNNRITLINVNSYKANILARQVSSLAQSQLDNTTSAGIELHLGAFTGIALLASTGPLVKLNLTPIGTISVSFKSQFNSAGINQTLHKIFINVQSSVYVVLPASNPKIDTSTEILLTEYVVIGEIPSTYLQSSYLDEMLNLVPI